MWPQARSATGCSQRATAYSTARSTSSMMRGSTPRFSDDRFFISIEAKDPQFDATETVTFLEGLGSSHVELVED
ncbi:MAG TPA: DUF3341 domain-containing protein [Planctomycetes bacterium]|nr:DUF3341 domain-containing protein [Planctomycetota bacterium]